MTISVESIKRSLLPGDGLYVEGDDASIYSTDDGKKIVYVCININEIIKCS